MSVYCFRRIYAVLDFLKKFLRFLIWLINGWNLKPWFLYVYFRRSIDILNLRRLFMWRVLLLTGCLWFQLVLHVFHWLSHPIHDFHFVWFHVRLVAFPWCSSILRAWFDYLWCAPTLHDSRTLQWVCIWFHCLPPVTTWQCFFC